MKIHKLYLAGRWMTPHDPIEVTNPATGEVMAQGNRSRGGRKGWRRLTGKQRGAYLRKMAALIERRRDEIARTITQENGKPLAESQAEVSGTIDHLEWFAEEARRAYGRIVPHQADGKRHLVVKVPVGVSGLISPWNFPLILAGPGVGGGLPGGAQAGQRHSAVLRGLGRGGRRGRIAGRRVSARARQVSGDRGRVSGEPGLPKAFTTNLSRMWRLAERLEAGTIGINDGVPSTSNCPFGGLKQSGWGRELGSEGIEAFLETKHVSLGVEA